MATGRGNMEMILDALASTGRSAVAPFMTTGQYGSDLIGSALLGGPPADWSSARDASNKLDFLDYQPGPEGLQAEQEAMQGAAGLYGTGFLGIKPLVQSGIPQAVAEKFSEIPEDYRIGAEALSSITPAKAFGLAAAPIITSIKAAEKLTDKAKTVDNTIEATVDTAQTINTRADPEFLKKYAPADDDDSIAAHVQRMIDGREPLRDYEHDVSFVPMNTIVPDGDVATRVKGGATAGQYRGAPRGVASPQKLGSLRTKLRTLLVEGTPGRDWYEQSTKMGSDLTGGRRNYKHLYSGANAITSRGANVGVNQGFGIKGSNQAVTGNKARSGRFPTKQGEAIDTLASGETYYGGPKETPFYEGLTIDERAQGIRPTNDLWMARAFDYRRPDGKVWGEGLGVAQHKFMDQEINGLVADANAHKLGGHDDWTPEKVQAAIWVAVKAKSEKTSIGKAAYDFSSDLDKFTTNVRFEVRPSASLNHMQDFGQSKEYSDIGNALLQTPTGEDFGALQIGALTRPSVPGSGEWEGVTSPSMSARIMAGSETGTPEIDPASRQIVEALTAGRGLTLGQDAVGWTSSRPPRSRIAAKPAKPGVLPTEAQSATTSTENIWGGTGSGIDAYEVPQRKASKGKKAKPAQDAIPAIQPNMVTLDLGGTPSPEAMIDLSAAVKAKFGSDAAVVHTDNGVQVLNFGVSPTAFNKGMKSIGEKYGATPTKTYNSGGLVGNADSDAPGFSPGYKPSEYMKKLDSLQMQPSFMKRVDEWLRGESKLLGDSDAALESRGLGTRDELLTRVRDIVSKDGLEGLRKAVAAGTVPAIFLSLMAAGGQPGDERDA